jgi:hypothetical protein
MLATSAMVIHAVEAVVGVTIRGLGSRTMIIWPAHSLRRASACSQASASCPGSVKLNAANNGEIDVLWSKIHCLMVY